MAVNTKISTGRAMNAPDLPVSNDRGMYFRNGDASVAATTVVKDAAGNEVTVNNLPSGGIIDWMKVVEVVSTSATLYEIYLWD